MSLAYGLVNGLLFAAALRADNYLASVRIDTGDGHAYGHAHAHGDDFLAFVRIDTGGQYTSLMLRCYFLLLPRLVIGDAGSARSSSEAAQGASGDESGGTGAHKRCDPQAQPTSAACLSSDRDRKPRTSAQVAPAAEPAAATEAASWAATEAKHS